MVAAGPTVRVGVAGAVHPLAVVAAAPSAWFGEVGAEVRVAHQPSDGFQVHGGAGVAVRDFVQYGDRVLRVALPRVSAGVVATRRVGRRIVVGGGFDADLDLAQTWLVDGAVTVPLFPVAARPGVSIHFVDDRRTSDSDPHIGGSGAHGP
jgi:hypothetical protein